MRKLIPIVMILMTAGAANAGGLVTKHASSVQLTVDAARSTATRLGSSYSVSGNGVNTTDGSTSGAVAVPTITSGIYTPAAITATQATDGNSFSFSASYTQGDAIPTTAATTGDIQNFGSMTSCLLYTSPSPRDS